MKLTKFVQSCVRLEDAGNSLVVDPGIFSDAAAVLSGASIALVTHEHPDHVDLDAIRAALDTNAQLRVLAPDAVTRQLTGSNVLAVDGGQQHSGAGFRIATFGGQHAVIHPRLKVLANVAYLVNERIYHPGDSFIVPTSPVDTLLLPLFGPWAKLSEVIDFMVAVRPARVVQMHDMVLTDLAAPVFEDYVSSVAAEFDIQFHHLNVGESIDL